MDPSPASQLLGIVGLLSGLSVFAWFLGGILGRLVAWGWRTLHGPERTETARRWTFALLLSWSGIRLAGLLRHPDPSYGVLAALSGALLIGASLLRVWRALGPEGLDAPLQAPATHHQDHDGFVVQLTHRAAGISALLAAAALCVPPLGIVAAWAWGLLPPRRVRLRVRGPTLEVSVGRDRTPLPLRGLSVARQVRWDGTPCLILSHGAQRVTLPVGGHPPAEIGWLLEQLRSAAALAQPQPRTPQVPEALHHVTAHATGARATPEQIR